MNWKFWKSSKLSSAVAATEPEPELELPRLTRDRISSLVYEKLRPQIQHVTYLDVWLSRDYTSDHWPKKLDEIESQIRTVRRWAEENTTGRIRAEYLQWLTYFFQWGVDEARKELRTQETRKNQDEYTNRMQCNSDSIAKYSANFPAPTLTRTW